MGSRLRTEGKVDFSRRSEGGIARTLKGTKRAFGEQNLPEGRREVMQREVSDPSRGAA